MSTTVSNWLIGEYKVYVRSGYWLIGEYKVYVRSVAIVLR